MPDDAAADVLADVLRRLSAVERRTAAVVRVGSVAGVQARPYRIRVNIGSEADPVVTGWVPVVVPRAGSSVVHSPLSEGEAVLLLSPGGGDAAFAVGSLPTSRHAPRAEDDEDGKTYHRGDLEVTGDLVVDGALAVTGDVSVGGDVSAEGGVSAEGNVSARGTVSARGDVVAGTGARVRLLTHVHNPPLGGPPQRV